MKVLFVCPPSEVPFKQDDQYPLGLLYLASVLEKEGHKVSVKDYFTEDWNKVGKSIIETIKKISPDILGLSCVTRNRTSCFKIIKIIKKINPKIKIIMGGVHASSMYKQILENFPVEAILMGESEITTPELIGAMEKNKDLGKIKGIAFMKGKKIKLTGKREPIHNLDSIPFPKHELAEDAIRKSKTALMITSRGCPFCCTFCSTSAYWGRRWRPRSAKNVLEEIEYIVKRFPYVKRLVFHDDTFIVDNQRVMAICDGLIERGIKLEWDCAGRIDRVSKEMLIKMKEAGCKKISYGVESGSEKILNSIDKNITKEQIVRAINITNEVGLKYHTYLMVGNPGETWETVKETTRFLRKLKNIEVDVVGRLEIYPNTKTYELAKRQGVIDDSYWLTDKIVPHYTYEHSEDELTNMAYYIVAKHQMNKGILNFAVFALKFFMDKPKKAIRYMLIKSGIIR